MKKFEKLREICTKADSESLKTHEKIKSAIFEKRLVRITYKGSKFWFFKGKERDYVIIPCTFCSCPDFQFNVLLRGTKEICYHLLAQRIAEERNIFTDLEVDSLDVINLITEEILQKNYSRLLRKLLFTKKS